MKRSSQILAGILVLTFIVAIAPLAAWASNDGPALQDVESRLLRQLEHSTGGKLRISRHAETGMVRFLGASPQAPLAQPALPAQSVAPEPAARAFLREYGALFGISNAEEELAVMAERSLEDGRSFVRYQQTHRGVPVLGGELIVQVRPGGAIASANGEVLPNLDLDVQPGVEGATARATALAKVARDYGMAAAELVVTEEPVLRIYDPALLGGPGPRFSALVWQVEVGARDLRPLRELVLVDAQRGHVALHFNQIHTAKDRKTYDAMSTSTLPGVLRRSEGQGAYGDPDVDEAHDFAGDTYDFYAGEHGRDSLDDAGMTLTSTTHYCPNLLECPYANAFWNGAQMVYGEGMTADDVVGHELTHGVTNFSSNLFYYYQSGAINESLSDVWGEFIDLTNNAGTDTAGVRWQLGEDLPGSIGVIRDLSDPPAHGDPDRIGHNNYYCDENDQGGVHTNSGVNNKAAYLLVDGDTFNGYTISGLGIQKVADLYYEAQTNLLTSGSNYADLYDALILAAVNLGFSTAEQQTVQDALDAVEMNQPPCGRPPEAPVCPAGQNPVYLFNDDLENAASGNWQSDTLSGTNGWHYPATGYARSGDILIWGQNLASTADYTIAMTSDVALPAGAYLRFDHDWDFETSPVCGADRACDGGVVEYSVDGGNAWSDAGALFSENGYNGTITATYDNPLGGSDAFTNQGYGYTASRLDLSSLAGESIRFRFRIGTDSIIGDYGWFIDDVGIYTCSSSVPDVGPVVYNGHVIDDDDSGSSSGNGDGQADCGENIELSVWLQNQGTDTAELVYATIDADDFYVTNIVDPEPTDPNIPGGDRLLYAGLYFEVAADAPDGHVINFDLNISDDYSNFWSDTFTVPVSCPIPAPAAPALDAIANGDGDGSYTVSWSAVSGADEYALQEQFDDGGWNTIYTGANTTLNSSGRADGEWCYRVRASNAGGDSDWSNVECTTVDTTPPPVPELLAPADGSTTSNSTPTFEWTSPTGATEFQLQVDGDADFSSPEIDVTVDTASYVPGSALADGTYAWRVRARDAFGNWSGWSSAWSVTIDSTLPCSIPGTPTLVAPVDGSTTGDAAPTFDWDDATNSDEYRIQVDDDPSFSSPERDATSTVSTFTPGAALADGTYSWRVRGHYTGSGCDEYGDWSEVWSVAIDAIPDPPQAPSLSPISNGDADGSYMVNWSAVAAADTYELQEQFDGGGWNTIYTGANTTLNISGRADGQWCYRVRASNAGGDGGWSNVECTTVDTTPPEEDEYTSFLPVVVGRR